MEYPNRKYPTTLVFFELSSPVNRRNLFVPLMEKFPGQKIHYLHPDFVFRSMRLWSEAHDVIAHLVLNDSLSDRIQ